MCHGESWHLGLEQHLPVLPTELHDGDFHNHFWTRYYRNQQLPPHHLHDTLLDYGRPWFKHSPLCHARIALHHPSCYHAVQGPAPSGVQRNGKDETLISER